MRITVYKYSFIAVAILAFSITSFPTYAQEYSNFIDGFGVEVGGGYNQLFWEATEFDGSKVNVNRTAFSLMPAARLSYNHNILNKITVYSFLGYNEFGGHSKLEESDAFLDPNVRYQDEYKFRSIEAGFLGTYPILSLHIGIGAKVSYQFDIEQRYYYENHPGGQNGWQTDDDPFFFNEWSLDFGVRLEYPIYQNYILGTEGWFGITDLGKNKYPIFVRENHFRLMIGYRF